MRFLTRLAGSPDGSPLRMSAGSSCSRVSLGAGFSLERTRTMGELTRSRTNGTNMAVAAALVVLGVIAYARVGGPLVIAGGLVVAVLLYAYRRSRS